MNRAPIKAKGKNAEVLIYSDIGEGYMGGISARAFAEDLRALGKLDEIDVRINSAGGDVFEGLAMYNTLIRNGAKIITHNDGMAFSIASVLYMAGHDRRAAENAMFMVHDPWTCACGGAQDFRDVADTLDKVKSSLVQVYAKATGLTEAEVELMMAAETWLSAVEAKDKGFAHTVTEGRAIAAHFDKSRFRNAPSAWGIDEKNLKAPPAAHWRLEAAERELQLLTAVRV